MLKADHARSLVLSLAVTGLFVLARWALDPLLGDALPLSCGYAAVVVVAWLAGWGPAALAAVLAVVANIYMFCARGDPARVLNLGELTHALTFLGISAIIIGVVESMHHAQRRLASAAERSRRLQEDSAALARRMTTLTDSLPALISYVNAQGRYEFNNQGYEEWFGHGREEFKGRHLRDVLGDEAYERIRPRVEAALAGTPAQFDDDLPCQRGGTRSVHAHYVPDRLPDGSVAGFYVLMTDITERRRAEAQVRESEQRFRALADSSPAMIWLHGPEGNEFVNREYLRFLGATAEQLRGEGWRGIVHPDDFPGYLAAFEEAVRGRSAFEGEARIRRYDGEYRCVRTFARPRLSPDGEFLGYAGLAVDTTDLRLAQRRVLESERLAAVGNLAAGLSHDMSNLILPLEMALGELRAANLQPDVLPAISSAERCARSLKDLVRGVRSLVRGGGAAGGPKRVDLREWWAETGSLLRASTPGRVRVTADLGDRPLPIRAVESDLTRAMLNLLVNAAEAMAEARTPEPAIVISGRASEDGTRVELSVSDNGPGIPAAVRDRVFEPFFSTKQGHSTGLGMSIVQEFVRACGGDLSLDTSEGGGTTFTMRFAASPGAAPHGPAESPPVHTVAGGEGLTLRAMIAGISPEHAWQPGRAAASQASLQEWRSCVGAESRSPDSR